MCLYSKNADVPDAVRNNDSFLSTIFDISVGATYYIYGQYILNGKLLYLIDPRDDSTPAWYPAELFEISDNSIPKNWSFKFFPETAPKNLAAIWGYEELVEDINHCDDLFEREPKALLIFAKRKLSLVG